MTDTLISATQLHNLIDDAIDEIYALRCAAAHEGVLIRQHLTYSTFPASRRQEAAAQVNRLFDVARGQIGRAYIGFNELDLDNALDGVAGNPVRTVDDWFAAKAPTGIRPATDPVDEELLRCDLKRAVRQIHESRRGLAHEGIVLLTHVELASFPRSEVHVAEASARRMWLAARGQVIRAYDDVPTENAMLVAGAPQTLKNAEWALRPGHHRVV